MNSLVKVFSNFKEFYSEINGATLTGAIDVIVVEQPNGTYLCSPFHVRFGKLGVLRSRQKIVDIEVNGEPVDIHMKLGESGEAFFVEECDEDDLDQLPANMATSPLPTSEFAKYVETAIFTNTNEEEEIIIDLPKPRRNSIDFSKEVGDVVESKFENQVSDYAHRRHTDTMERHNLSCAKKEYTTQKIRQDWAEREEHMTLDEEWTVPTVTADTSAASSVAAAVPSSAEPIKPVAEQPTKTNSPTATAVGDAAATATDATAAETKSKKKRRKKSMMKKKATQRKGSSSSSVGSAASDVNDVDTTTTTATSSSTEDSPKSETAVAKLSKPAATPQPQSAVAGEAGPKTTTSTEPASASSPLSSPSPPPSAAKDASAVSRARDLDIHFFSDTELASAKSPEGSRPSTPIQSDSEFEMSQRIGGLQLDKAELLMGVGSSASWKWGELPTQGNDTSVATTEDAKQAQRQSMLSNMFSFMKQSKKKRKSSHAEGVYLSDLDTDGMDPEVAALYFPPHVHTPKDAAPTVGDGKEAAEAGKSAARAAAAAAAAADDDRESGNGTSLPHSPSSMDGLKSLDSDYDDGKPGDNKCLDFVAMSLCGGIENGAGPTDEEFERNLIEYTEVCQNPSIFASPLLVVRLNGKYYSWAAACPIVMTIIAYQKPLTIDAIEQLMNKTPYLGDDDKRPKEERQEQEQLPTQQQQQQQQRGGYSSWWSWRRSGGGSSTDKSPQQQQLLDAHHNKSATSETGVAGDKDADGKLLAPQSDNSLGETASDEATAVPATTSGGIDVPLPADGSSAVVPRPSLTESELYNKSLELSEDAHTGEMYRKSLRLTSKQIEGLNLKHGMNEISFSVTTAYQGTSRCKCQLFRWKHNDKVVISDIDGTITKSDVLGHILPMVGRDWAQIGVAQLFSKIEENGYKLLYLSARAIGQSRATREYLRSIRQGDVKLPDGPLLLNPTSLISAFHREVIEKKPEQFKIACLSDIRDLFPDKNPFYAGYGNRINDVWAYRAVGIPIMRIFTINPKGELKHELTQTFQSSYCNMAYIADQLFPPIATIEESAEFSNFNYWREPVFELDDLVPQDVLDAATASATVPALSLPLQSSEEATTTTTTATNTIITSTTPATTAAISADIVATAAAAAAALGSSGVAKAAAGEEAAANPGSPGAAHSKALPTIPENR